MFHAVRITPKQRRIRTEMARPRYFFRFTAPFALLIGLSIALLNALAALLFARVWALISLAFARDSI